MLHSSLFPSWVNLQLCLMFIYYHRAQCGNRASSVSSEQSCQLHLPILHMAASDVYECRSKSKMMSLLSIFDKDAFKMNPVSGISVWSSQKALPDEMSELGK
jgi:hypothetical protein